MKVMMLAAGFGARLVPHTITRPKPGMPFLNVPLAAYGLELISQLKPTGLVVNTFHLSDLVTRLFATDLAKWTPPLEFSHETNFIRGSGGGLKLAEKYFQTEDEIILMNSDEVFFPKDENFLQQALEFHREKRALSTLITTHNHEVGKKFGGIWTTDYDQVMGFGKDRIEGSIKGQHFIGIQILSKEIFKFITADKECNIIYDGLQSAMKQGKICWAFPVEGVWFETGNQNDFLDATRESLNLLTLTDSKPSQYLHRFLKKYSPRSHFKKTPEALVLAHKSARWGGDQVVGFGVLGANSEIIEGAQINSSVVGDLVQIKADLNFSIKLQ